MPELTPTTLLVLEPLIRAKGSSLSPEEFHAEVNLAFHNAESSAYDVLHRTMWQSLPVQFELLADGLAAERRLPDTLVVLDVGSGTGLSSELLLRTSLGPRIRRIDLLDTSPGMLSVSTARAQHWGVPFRAHHGGIEGVSGESPYDLILACSVLHHIPELPAFLGNVHRLQRRGGAFLHLQDPDAESIGSRRLARRRLLMRAAHRMRRLFSTSAARGDSGEYLNSVNRTLLDAGVVKTGLTAEELWSVTDIHVPGNAFGVGNGVSMELIRGALPGYSNVVRRSYGFFGQLAGDLPAPLRWRERALVTAGAPEGYFLAGAWARDQD
jgi:SAM-dependent methyltransferase